MIYIGTDHAGFKLKEYLKSFLKNLGHEVIDCGAKIYNKDDDYPDFIKMVARALQKNPEALGIVLGSSGNGEALAANRYQGVRATVYYGGTLELVTLAREHNNANILSLGASFISNEDAEQAVDLFLSTPFSNDKRHVRRLKKVETL